MAPQRLKRLLTEKDFTKDLLLHLFDRAAMLEKEQTTCAKDKILATYTNGPSTRTMFSSAAAFIKIGGQVYHIPSHGSSEDKDETFEDTLVTLATIGADILAVRHNNEEAFFAAAARVAQMCPTPIINCGSGGVHHPTQAGGDIFTVHREYGTLNNLKIACIGGIGNSRAVNSFIYLLTHWAGIKLYLVSNEELKGSLRLYLEDNKDRIEIIETSDLNEVLPLVDVVYQSRIQWDHASDPQAARQERPSCVLNRRNVGMMRKDAIILHPWPRNKELLREVDLLPQQRYIKLMHNATLMRMALFENILGH